MSKEERKFPTIEFATVSERLWNPLHDAYHYHISVLDACILRTASRSDSQRLTA